MEGQLNPKDGEATMTVGQLIAGLRDVSNELEKHNAKLVKEIAQWQGLSEALADDNQVSVEHCSCDARQRS